MSDLCTPPTTRWPCATHATSTPGATRASASGWSGPSTSPPPARTRRTRSSRPAATRSTGTPRSTTSPTKSRGSEVTMAFDNVYEAITEQNDARWAYGTGFTAPLDGIDTTVPEGIDHADLAAYCLMLGDDALIMSHRLQEWCTNAPELEEEVALANIALDLLGQARLLLARCGDEDALAFGRTEREFRNVRLLAPPSRDF